jgi:polyisoprenoid-binding protein YceI
VDGTVRGSFDLHGVTRPVEAELNLTLNANGSLTVHATFQVVLADHGIDRPKFLMLKLDEMQRITVDLLAQPAGDGGTKE